MPHRVLISDTQIASRRMLRFAMDIKGYEVSECVGADQTLALLAEQRVDLLLVSLYPQDGMGYSVLERLSESLGRETLPVIVIGDTVLRADFDSHQPDRMAWLDRPFRVSELLNLVDSILSIPSVLPLREKGLA